MTCRCRGRHGREAGVEDEEGEEVEQRGKCIVLGLWRCAWIKAANDNEVNN